MKGKNKESNKEKKVKEDFKKELKKELKKESPKKIKNNMNNIINISAIDDFKNHNENLIFKKIDNTISSQNDKDVLLKKIELETKKLMRKLSIFFPSILSKSKIEEKKYLKEYYDLNNNYNITTIRIIPQSPTRIFVYWELSSNYAKKIEKDYGKEFWESTYPVLVVKNLFDDSSFEININDFATSWYIDVPNSNSKYEITLARRIKNDIVPIDKNYPKLLGGDIFIISSSNITETPNDRILNNTDYLFKDTKSNEIINVDIQKCKKAENVLFKKLYNISENELKNLESSR